MDREKRRAELENIIRPEHRATAAQIIEEILFIEERLEFLRRLPFLKIDPKNPTKQKATPASRQYKELLQQYTNSLKTLVKISGETGEAEQESPLRQWIRRREKADA